MISGFGVEHVEISKVGAAQRRANDMKGGLARPGGSPAKDAPRIEDTRAAARLKGKLKPVSTGLLSRLRG